MYIINSLFRLFLCLYRGSTDGAATYGNISDQPNSILSHTHKEDTN